MDSTSTHQNLTSLIGHAVFDSEGNKIGTAGSIYESDSTGAPEWVTVKTGMFGGKESFVPLNGAEADSEGLHVMVTKDSVRDAPQLEKDGHLSEAENAQLRQHYGLRPGTAVGDAGQGRGMVPGQRTEPDDREAQARTSPGAAGQQAADRPAEGDTGHHSVLRHEERLRAGTETVESGRVRLHKRVVTSEQQITVPIRREEVRVTREPVKPGEAPADASLGEEEREIILHEERPVLDKDIVPVERISLDTQTVRDNREVSGTIRREEVEIEDNTKRQRR